MPDRILIVHHERLIAEVICSYLLEANLDASFECTYESAIENAKESPPQLLIVDPVTPAPDGGDVAKEIFSRTGCKILVINCGADQKEFAEYLGELRDLGCDADLFLVPFEKPQLLLQIKNQLTRRMTRL